MLPVFFVFLGATWPLTASRSGVSRFAHAHSRLRLLKALHALAHSNLKSLAESFEQAFQYFKFFLSENSL